MDKQTEQLDMAIKALKNSQAFNVSADKSQTELTPLLEISQSLLALPKNPVPTPLMSHRYLSQKTMRFWFAWTRLTKFTAVSAAALLLISALGATGYGAWASTPGQTLFAVKKSAEKLQMVLAYSQNQKANLQLALTQKRLDEAQKIFQDPQSNIEQEKAALSELSDQTKNAVDVVGSVTKNNPQGDNNHPLVSSLENITQQQQTLLKDIKANTAINSATSDALASLDQNTAKLSEIKQSIDVASSNQAATLTQLAGDPNAVAILGAITAVEKDKITVENTTFTLNALVVIKGEDGSFLSYNQLTPKTKVKISGTKTPTALVAKEIILTDYSATENKPEVKSASIVNATSTGTATEKTTSTQATKVQIDPNQAQGSYIYEDPSPQFVQ